MAEEKKVIHVKDLVIKADNVHFEPTTPVTPPQQESVQQTPGVAPRRPFDGFFGRRGMEQAPAQAQEASVEEEELQPVDEDVKEEEETTQEPTEEAVQAQEEQDTNQPAQRRPFSWI